jgi:multidrug efflux pump subunit AcrA (membrane-fusion protein)
VEIEVPNPEQLLKPGMFVRAKIEFARHDNATLVPFAALVRREGEEGIFIADLNNLKARFVPVTTGIINGELAEIIEPAISGLAVTLGNHLLEDGSDIIISDKKEMGKTPQNTDMKSDSASVSTRSGDSR